LWGITLIGIVVTTTIPGAILAKVGITGTVAADAALTLRTAASKVVAIVAIVVAE